MLVKTPNNLINVLLPITRTSVLRLNLKKPNLKKSVKKHLNILTNKTVAYPVFTKKVIKNRSLLQGVPE